MPQNELGCARCAQLENIIKTLEANMVELTAHKEQEIAGMELQLRRAGAAEVALRTELRRQRGEEPDSEVIRGRLDKWLVVTGRAARKGRRPSIAPGGKRWEIVKKALKLKNIETGKPYSVEELDEALEGLGLYPFVGPKGRQQFGSKRYDEIEHALGDETKIDRFIGYARNFYMAAHLHLDEAVRRWHQASAQEALMAAAIIPALNEHHRLPRSPETVDGVQRARARLGRAA